MDLDVATDISLLRHGETEGGARYRGSTDVALTAAGWAAMWAAVGDKNWDRIVCSPLQRCADFARALAQQRSLPLALDTRWREMNFGAWEGKTAAEITGADAAALARFWEDPSNNGPPGGEPLAAVRARVLDAWRDVTSSRQSTLVITHGGPIRLILCHEAGHPFERLLEMDVAFASLHRLRRETQSS